MKRLVMINGTMGSGKTTTCKELLKILQPSAFLDGDWCWEMNPFIVTVETKRMVIENITYLLKNFLNCSEYDNVIFCWVMHDEQIIEEILNRLNQSVSNQFKVHKITLMVSEEALEERILKDVKDNNRNIDVLERSLERLKAYEHMNTNKVDVSEITPQKAAKIIAQKLM